MLDLHRFREHPEEVAAGLHKRGVTTTVEHVLGLDKQRREGLTEVESRQIELMQSYASTPRELLLKVRVPNALPYLFSALKVGTTLSVIAAIVSEYFGGSRDALGIYISQQASLFHFAEAWAAILVASFSGIVFYLLIALVERAVMPWHSSIRNVAGT